MNYKKIATGISWVLHPFLLPVYLMAVLLTMTAFSHYPPNVKFYLLWVVALYAIVIPLLSLGVLRSLGRISDYRIDDRRERFLPLLVGAVCYVLCAITIAKIPSAIFLRKFMVAAACCEVLCLVVSFYWKISLHLTGMGAVVALLVVMNVVGATCSFPSWSPSSAPGRSRRRASTSDATTAGRCWPDSAAVSPCPSSRCFFCKSSRKNENRPETVSGRFFVVVLPVRRSPGRAWRWRPS